MTLQKADSILDLVGCTPLVRINRLNKNSKVEIWAKLEFMNPGGSIKDRSALNMIRAAEANGELKPNQIVLEATSGNTGIGLAMVCAVKGYKMLFTMSEAASAERRKILKAYGAKILLTPAHLGTDGAIEEAYRLAREEPNKYFLLDQFNNENNWRAHYISGTADEIFKITEGQVTHVVITMGTTGTLMGVTRRLHELNPKIKVIGVEPYQGHKIQGLKNMKESYPPGIFNPNELDCIVNIDDDSAYETARQLALEEGIFVGMSAGAAMWVAIRRAAKLEQGLVVAILPDGGERYLSTPLFTPNKIPSQLFFYNTLSHKIENFLPLQNSQVGIYACGPSLDGLADLGLCRRMIFTDLIRRYMEFRGFEVKLVINIGDIDDRTVNQCLRDGEKITNFTARWEKAFFEDMAILNVMLAHHYPKASEHVGAMVEETRQLLKKGLAYEKLRSIYFNISRFPDYGKLSRVKLNSIQRGKTVDYDYYDKKNPRDFTLFKRASLAELKAGIYWQIPWGNVRPGWHIECATMATHYLGQPFDIHIASTDLIFPHGDNEIAIAESLVGLPFANLWLHSEVVMAEGHKISRTHGNNFTLKDVLMQGHSPKAIRYWLLSQHYRRVLTYNKKQIILAGQIVNRLNYFMQRLLFYSSSQTAPDVDQIIYEAKYGYQKAMDHDLNLPKAMGYIFAFIKKINRLLDNGLLDEYQINQVFGFMSNVDLTLGVMDFRQVPIGLEIQKLITQREEARRDHNFCLADIIRKKLANLKIRIIDTPTGPRWEQLEYK